MDQITEENEKGFLIEIQQASDRKILTLELIQTQHFCINFYKKII